MRTYKGFLIDSSRWERFLPRPDDVIIATPAKCGTTWVQHLVGMLLMGTTEFGQPLTRISPWLDALFTSEQQVFETLGDQTHRRFIKTHTPLDGLPWRDSWIYITVFRHPLDAALSWRNHIENSDPIHIRELVAQVTGRPPEPPPPPLPTDPAAYLRYWIDSEVEPNGAGLLGLSDYANTLRATWERRHESNVHLFHYDALWGDLGGQVGRLADILNVALDADRLSAIVEAATLDAMRSRARETAPYGDATVFKQAEAFFRSGGRREWPALLTSDEISEVARRLEAMVGREAAAWALQDNTANRD
ncbi:sulfotransferase domain-containing protein [Marimonas sp. MJW-29]|uniref:Sulfotransferase domain-containing protein n=1 Tax=Sulfitobacter sediminis TaxID=3234186 RepID=A0ABV3RQM1_9RHOB